MKSLQITDWCHEIFERFVPAGGVYIDATIGQGQDTLFLCRLAGEFPPERIEAVVIDPSAASFIECVESHRVFRVVRADNRVREGIAAVSRWLAEGKLSFDPGCDQCIREFSLYRWEDGGSERPVKEQDHAMDDLRYFVMYCEQEEKPGGFCAARVERTRR